MKYVFYALGLVTVCIVAVILIWTSSKPAPLLLQGEVGVRQVMISPRVVGQVEEIFVKEGAKVKKGEWLAKLDAPTIKAKEVQAQAALRAADAQRNKVFAGARPEEVVALKNVYEKALAAEELANKTYSRVKSLYDDGLVPAQQLDEAFTRYQASKNDANGAKAQYEIAQIGARPEDKNAASALAQQATGALQEVAAYMNDTMLISPIDGEIGSIIVSGGELVTPGFPVFSILDTSDIWITFHIREDLLRDIKIGSVLNVQIPALSADKVYLLNVTYISALGDYAVKSATKAQGSFELKTFQVKAYPKEPLEGMKAGMSVLFYMTPTKN